MSDEFNRKLSELEKAAERLQPVVHKQALRVQAQAKQLCPVRRYGTGGSLRQSIHVATERQGDLVHSEIYTNSEYAPYVEFGTGPTGQAHHEGTSPDVNPVYSQSGWVIPADAMSPDEAEQYGFGIAKGKDGEIIGYYTKGQVAQPFMYPAFAGLQDSIEEEIQKALQQELKKVTI